jgi:hypothetical protein
VVLYLVTVSAPNLPPCLVMFCAKVVTTVGSDRAGGIEDAIAGVDIKRDCDIDADLGLQPSLR